jgi:hypothetical protein
LGDRNRTKGLNVVDDDDYDYEIPPTWNMFLVKVIIFIVDPERSQLKGQSK